MTQHSCRRWCVTLFAETYSVPENPWVTANVRYVIGQREIAPETGRKHYQLYVELLRTSRLPGLQQHLFGGVRVHAEPARGGADACVEYCTKEDTRDPDGDRVEFGARSGGQGTRRDLSELRDRMRDAYREGGEDAAWSAAYDANFGAAIAYTRGISAYLGRLAGGRAGLGVPPTVEVHVGPTGVGKTHNVYAEAPDVYSIPPPRRGGSVWFPGYQGQASVLIDDFDGDCISMGYMLRLLDRYPLQVEVKGGFVSWQPTRIYITTNLPLHMWYDGVAQQHKFALYRRITHLYEWKRGPDGVTQERVPREVWDHSLL